MSSHQHLALFQDVLVIGFLPVLRTRKRNLVRDLPVHPVHRATRHPPLPPRSLLAGRYPLASRAKHAQQAVEAAHAFHTTRSPTEEDKGACAVLAKALADGSNDAEEALEVRDLFVVPYRQTETGLSAYWIHTLHDCSWYGLYVVCLCRAFDNLLQHLLKVFGAISRGGFGRT